MIDSLVLRDHIYNQIYEGDEMEVLYCWTFLFVINQEHDSWRMKEFCAERLTSLTMIYPSFLENSLARCF